MSERVIGLYDVDSTIPNLALLKLAAYHRARGDHVERFNPLMRASYEVVYASKVFDFTPAPYLDDHMVRGGTGFGGGSRLPPEVERAVPQAADYALWRYPHSIGFTMRGCRFACAFCVVPEKEGRPAGDTGIADIWTNRGSRLVVLLDNDFFGGPAWRDHVAEIRALDLLVSFSQGLNIRIITDEQAAALAGVKFRNLKGTKKQCHFAWDRIRDERLVLDGIDRCLAAGLRPNQMAFFVLVGFDTTPAEDLRRVTMLADLGCDPFVMPYNRRDPYQRAFARWVNHKAVFRTTTWAAYRAGVKRAGAPQYGQGGLFTAQEQN